jgi:hypothetical protein
MATWHNTASPRREEYAITAAVGVLVADQVLDHLVLVQPCIVSFRMQI